MGKEYERDRFPSYLSNVFALLGTLLLFISFPAWNAGLAHAGSQFRVAIAAVLGVMSSAVMAFLTSRLLGNGKFNMADIQHGAIAGGIAVGGAVGFVVSPGGASVVGGFVGASTVFGFSFLRPFLEAKFHFMDIGGVLPTHGIPG